MAVKRGFDLVVGGLFFLCFLPILAVMAVVIKLDSKGPVFFRQERMGRGGRSFMIYKFRSMYVGADAMRAALADQNEYSGPMFKIRADPRITRVGRFVRRWSIDELPQIINVMTGDMSLVGPRPLWVDEARQVRGWTQKRLAEAIGTTDTAISRVESGRHPISLETLTKLGSALDIAFVVGSASATQHLTTASGCVIIPEAAMSMSM